MAPVRLINQEDEEIPQWQKDIVNARIEKYENKPESMIDEDLALEIIDSK